MKVSGDGFVYFENGSYCWGPLNLQSDRFFTVSIGLSRSRVYVEGDIDEDDYELDGNMAMELPVVPVSEEEIADVEVKFNEEFALDMVFAVPAFARHRQVKATLPGTDKEWKRDSLVWTETRTDKDFLCESQGPYQFWLLTTHSESTTDLNFGVACVTTGFVQNMVRSYHKQDGQLIQVELQEGLCAPLVGLDQSS